MTTITSITWNTVIRPLRTTFATALGSKRCASSVIVTVRCSDGAVGIGEVPTSFILPNEIIDTIKTVLGLAKSRLLGKSIERWASLAAWLRTMFGGFPMTLSGLETALFRSFLATQRKSELAWWGGKHHTVTTDITLPFVKDPSSLEPWIRRAIHRGFDTFKVKVSGHINHDTAFVRYIAERLAQSGIHWTIRLDGNQGFCADSALGLLKQLERLHIPVELFEQPLKRSDYKGMKILYKNSPVPVVADETVFDIEDCKRVIDRQLAHGINVKLAKSGIRQSRDIIRLARQAGLKLMIGCMTETMVGLSASLYCAAGCGVFDYIDLDSVHFLHHRGRDGIVIDGCTYHLETRQ